MRYRLPEGCAGVTHAGVALDRARDDTVEAEEGDALHLAPHGILPIDTNEPAGKAASARTKANDRRMLR